MILTTPQAAEYLGCSASYLNKLRLTGEGPQFSRVGKRAIRYSKDSLDEWLVKRTYHATSQY